MTVKTIGIIGGGQLGMMLTQAAHKLGFAVNILEKSYDCPAYSVLELGGDRFINGDLSDYDKLLELASCSDVLTFEIEHINTSTMKQLELETGKKIFPSPVILEIINDKYSQKSFLKKAGLPLGKFEPIRSIKNFDKLVRQFGYPFIIKSRKGGYDGGGNFVIKNPDDLAAICTTLKLLVNHEDFFVEKFVPFDIEISVLLARSLAGDITIYPVIDTLQENNVCCKTFVPSSLSQEIQENAKLIGIELAKKFEYTGIMAVEMFALDNGDLLINEIAPRVHNSGHWTIDGSNTSQFEQHIRCITGMLLESVESKSPATLMINILGTDYHIIQKLKETNVKNTTVYDYNKKLSRPNRKMGHINITGKNLESVQLVFQGIKNMSD